MFHKNALFINGAFLGFCAISFGFSCVMNVTLSEINLFNIFECYLSQIKLVFQFIIFFYFMSVLFVIIFSHLTKVKVGKPLEECLTIAYKYDLSDSISTSAIMRSSQLFPSCDTVQICYERKIGPFGLAHGLIVPDQLTDEKKMVLLSHGYSFLKTKPVSNAVYISSPTIPWLSCFGQWLILCVIYPKLYKYSKRHKLSAYPVVELYRRFSVSLIAPLSHQDVFVVPEAECLMQRSSRRVDMTDSSMTEKSLSTSYHSTRVKLSESNLGTAKLTPKPSVSPINRFENTKISPGRSLTPLGNSYTAKIILKHSLTPVNNNVVQSILVRTSTPIVSNGHHASNGGNQ